MNDESHQALLDLTREWLADRFPSAKFGSVSREFDGVKVVFTSNYALAFEGSRFLNAIAARYCRTVILSASLYPSITAGQLLDDYTATVVPRLNSIKTSLSLLAAKPIKAQVRHLRKALSKLGRELPDTFPDPHPRNKLITALRVESALYHRGDKRAATYHLNDDGEPYGFEMFDSIDDAVLFRLSSKDNIKVVEFQS